MSNMSPWPAMKISRPALFTHTRLDYMGPLCIKEEGSKKNVCICFFICVTITAIHLGNCTPQ